MQTYLFMNTQMCVVAVEPSAEQVPGCNNPHWLLCIDAFVFKSGATPCVGWVFSLGGGAFV